VACFFGKMAKQDFQKTVEISNKRASFEYFFLDKYTAGLVLQGTEIKSIRLGKVNLSDAYCLFLGAVLFVRNLHISKYEQGTYANHDPLSDRKLLLNKKELSKLSNKLKDQGLTIVPTRLFVNEKGLAKLDIALAKGKKIHDKRDTIKEKDIKRDLERD
jgi:SsrA-binding protein